MTEEEILEFNKKCAEFLEISNFKDSEGDLWDVQKTGKQIYSLRTRYLRFDSDWNWIMKVVKAIESIKYNTSGETIYTVTISKCLCRIDTVNEEIVWLRAKTKEEAIVQSINKFLIWYNANNPQN